ncbi:MAG: hypothetical protein K2I32_01905, partial [Alistipes sp.]|nr:hypothetical protein [Alistipes sp.]
RRLAEIFRRARPVRQPGRRCPHRQGLSQAAKNGSKLGRPAGPSPGMAIKYQEGLKRYKEGGTLSGIAQELGFNRICFAKWMDENYPGLRKRNARRKQS